ncbi:MAG: TonB-dependent receptor [bacterium]|nr:TonB-dependent receptor [bacterium]
MKNLLVLGMVVTLVAGLGFDVLAQEEFAEASGEELLFMEIPMVITATRREQPITEAPANVIVITEEMIKERGYLDLKDVFQDLPGFDLSTNIYGEFSTLISQRGIGENNKLLLLLDGKNISCPSGKQFSYGNNVPLGNVERIEIVYGPGSALYGAGAFGIVNIITKSSTMSPGTHIHLGAGQFETYNNWIHHSKWINEDMSYSIFARLFRTSGQDLSSEYNSLSFIKTGYPNWPVRAEYEDPVKDYNIGLNLDIRNLSLSFDRSSYHEQLSKGLIPEHYVYNEEAYWAHTINKLSMKHRYSRNEFNLNSKFSLSQFEIDPEMNWYYLLEDGTTLQVHQYGKTNGIKVEEQGDYTFANRLNLMIGAIFEDITGLPIGDVIGEPFDRDSMLQLNNFYNDDYPQAALSSQNYGIFVQAMYPYKDKLYFTLGTRHDYNTIYKGVTNPRLSLVYQRTPSQIFKLLYGQAYIAPSYFHRYEVWFTYDYGHVQNLDLKPEKLKTAEIVWSQDWSKNMKTNISAYYNIVDDLIVRRLKGQITLPDHWGDTTPWVEWNDNFGELESYGIDSQFDYWLGGNLKMYLAYSFMDGHTTHPEESYKDKEFDLFKTSKHKVMAGATIKSFKNLSLTPRIRWVSDIATRPENVKYGENNPHTGKYARMPGYSVVDLNMVYVGKNMDIHLLVNNLLNKKYYTAGVSSENTVYLPEVPQDLRRILLGLTYHF